MYKDWSYGEVKEKADAIKAIGDNEIYLNKGEFPWHLATHCETGGSHRIDISTSVMFSGEDPKSGIQLRWSFNIESHKANGKGHYDIDVASCQMVLRNLSKVMAVEFRKYLNDCADAVEKNAKEYEAVAGKEYVTAHLLRSI